LRTLDAWRAIARRAAVTRSYDLAMRLPIIVWATAVAGLQLAGLVTYLATADWTHTPALVATTVAARLSLILFLAVIGALTVLRAPRRDAARGLEPRISALLGSFLSYGLLLFPRHELSLAGSAASTVLLLIGNILAICVITRLGRSFSVMAEARRLVTSGAYRFVRHPLYLAEQIATVGAFLQFASVWTALLLVCQLAFQLRRMQHEERVLTAQFPEYVAYSQGTARLVPGLY